MSDIIFPASEDKSFVYRIEGGMDDRDRDEIEAMDSGYVTGQNWPAIVSDSVDIGHRMRYMRKRNLGLRFVRIEYPDFENTLRFADEDLPEIIAWMVSEAYLGGTSRIEDITDNIESANPLKYERPRSTGIYRRKIDGFLQRIGASGRCTVDRVPVGRFGNAEIWKSGISSYEMRLVLQIKA